MAAAPTACRFPRFPRWSSCGVARGEQRRSVNYMRHLTEDEIEIQAERMQDRLDRRFGTSDMTEMQYEAECEIIRAWVREQYEAKGGK
jgi:hypothetical protein